MEENYRDWILANLLWFSYEPNKNSFLTDQEEYGEDAGGEEPGPVHVVEDIVRVQPQVRDGEVQLLHRHVVLREHFKMAPWYYCLPSHIHS